MVKISCRRNLPLKGRLWAFRSLVLTIAMLFVILISSLVMTYALIRYRGEKVSEVLLSQLPNRKVDKDRDGLSDEYQDEMEDNVEKQDFNQF